MEHSWYRYMWKYIADLQMPKIEFRSNARPSMFAYPPPLEEKKREEREKVTTAVLSIAARARRREAGRIEAGRSQRDSDKMDVVRNSQLWDLRFSWWMTMRITACWDLMRSELVLTSKWGKPFLNLVFDWLLKLWGQQS